MFRNKRHMHDTAASAAKPKVRPELRISLFLVISTLAVYWQVRRYEFVNFDDFQYVVQNPIVLEGLGYKGILWAFTKIHAGFRLPAEVLC